MDESIQDQEYWPLPGPFRRPPQEPFARTTLVYAFNDRPVRIIWIDQRGTKLYEQLVDFVPSPKEGTDS